MSDFFLCILLLAVMVTQVIDSSIAANRHKQIMNRLKELEK